MNRKQYEKELNKLQVRLCHLQAYVKEKGLRVVIILEGRDGACLLYTSPSPRDS